MSMQSTRIHVTASALAILGAILSSYGCDHAPLAHAAVPVAPDATAEWVAVVQAYARALPPDERVLYRTNVPGLDGRLCPTLIATNGAEEPLPWQDYVYTYLDKTCEPLPAAVAAEVKRNNSP